MHNAPLRSIHAWLSCDVNAIPSFKSAFTLLITMGIFPSNNLLCTSKSGIPHAIYLENCFPSLYGTTTSCSKVKIGKTSSFTQKEAAPTAT